jgi:hypothetical protein
MCNCESQKYAVHEEQITDTKANYLVDATCIMFQNQGDYPVRVGLVLLMPGDSYKFDIMPPHSVKHTFGIRFADAPVSTGGSARVVPGKLLVVSSLNPINPETW